ncbi:MAG: ABC transporter ATP-binding protein [Variibacter sp.]|nr:ABC transporter ATP-binding protein [Variibacter sp.]
MESSGAAFITVRNLTKRFGAFTAVDKVSFEVAEGHTLALLGPSGCGKTTILRCLAGLETPEEGYIRIGGTVVYDSEARINLMPEARELGIVFQSYAVWPHMTVAENVGFPLKVRKVGKAEMRERVVKILEIVGLGAWIDRPATQLSGGQQQRVALARALVHEPRLVLFDEPMSNLDAQLREQVRMELKVLQERLDFTAIYVTHDQSEAFALAEKIIVMNRGHIDTVGPPKEVFAFPSTPFVARFLGLNVMQATVADTAATPPATAGDSGRSRGGYAQVTLDGGGPTLWGRVSGETGVKKGDKVLAAIRKEHVGIRMPTGNGAAGQSFAGQIRAASFLGLVEEYIVAVGNSELRAIQPAGGADSGANVEVSVRPDDCIVLAGADAIPAN